MIFYRILIFFGATLLGILILKYTALIVNNLGRSEWAERYFGFGSAGGTYNFWKIIGILIIVAGVVVAIKGW